MSGGRGKGRALADDLRREIVSGARPVGSALPSLREAAHGSGVSLNTAKAAFALLVSEGLIESRSTSGYYVVRTEPARTLEERVASLEAWRERLERGDA